MSINHGYHVVPLSQTSLINDANLVSYWKMDGNSLDSKGTNHGTNTDVNFSNVGKFGNCASFNGSTSYILVPNNSSINPTSSITINAWVNVSVFKENANVISKSYIAAVPPHMQYSLKFTASSPYASPGFEVTIGDVAKLDCYSSEVLVTNKWYCLTGTYDGNNIKLYIDGVLSKSVTQTGSLSTYTGSLSIGRWNVNASQYFNGKIDEVTIFSRALTSSEILQLATGCQNKELYTTSFYSDPNLVAYWRLSDLNEEKNSYTLTNNGSATFSTGKFGNGVDFGTSNTSKYLSRSSVSLLPSGTSPRTLSFWFYAYSMPVTLTLIFGLLGDGNHTGCMLGFSPTTLYWAGFDDDVSTPYVVTLNCWNHMVGTYDGTTAKFYMNGNFIGSGIPSAWNTAAINLLISDTYWWFSGKVDDAAIFNRALTAREVLQLYRQR